MADTNPCTESLYIFDVCDYNDYKSEYLLGLFKYTYVKYNPNAQSKQNYFSTLIR